MAADLAYSRELHPVKDGMTSDFVETLRGTSFAGTLVQLSKKLPIIALLAPLFVPLRVLRTIPAVFRANSAEVQARIDKRGKPKHPDLMDFMISPEAPPPASQKEPTHIEKVAFQMFVACFDPVQVAFYAVLFFLLKHPKIHALLTKEIRDAFKSYDETTLDALVQLKYLHAFIYETPRVHLTTPTGMPRMSWCHS
ncbi:cytochrome P450 [Diplogelasinospora grovesii]|uniref:Cytochrome P450 n=1 Tax=Diplogelasinospora grovesii TaxID=303347 RepID=A0AAN6S3Y7_9PEZI|nr:cytochrome P450 [Diplogelasinospora grovesii]